MVQRLSNRYAPAGNNPEPELCRDSRDRRIAAAMATARTWSVFSRLISAASARTDLDRAIRPSNTAHSSSAIDDTASIASSDGSSRNRLLRIGRASILPIRPRADAADVATLRSRSSRRSIKIKINSGNGRAQRQASARMPGSACRISCRKASGDRVEPRRAAALTAICNVGPCTTARSIISDTASAASRPPIMARPSIAAACSQTMRRVPNPAKRRHSVTSAGTAAASCRRPASAARLQLSARLTSELRRSASHRRSRLILGHGPCLVKGPARPRRRCPRKTRAVVQTSGHDARSRRCVKSAMNNTNRKIFWIVLHRERGASRNREDRIAPAPVRRNELPPD